ncbi:DUF1345 domain-containing protein [Agromyces mediolanus]|uniref:DUF1345 domain-containing protein n=1 Tax=Agromyces mediolanus TaxID=41986 RepID=UPI0038334388
MPTARSTEHQRADAGAIVAESLGLLIQIPLVWLGVEFIIGDDIELLVGWCLVGTFYLLVTIVALNLAVRLPALMTGRSETRRFLAHPFMRVAATLLTFSSSTVGVVAAVQLILLRNDPEWSGFIELVAVWAMLVAWGLFHWGWARIYYSRYHRAVGTPPLEFPRTPEPELIEFVYFAFTNATNFSVSDVQVTTTRMRWTVIWHTSLSFFFNALILVLAINTITGIQVDPGILK